MRTAGICVLALWLAAAAAARAQALVPIPASPPLPGAVQPAATLPLGPADGTAANPDVVAQAPATEGTPSTPSTAPGGPSTGSAPETATTTQPGRSMADVTGRTSEATREALRDTHVGPDYEFWVRGDYLLWFVKRGPLTVPLLTTGGLANAGNLGAPDTTVLFGGQNLDYGTRSGGRVDFGLWLNDPHTWGLDAGGFVLGRRTLTSSFSSDQDGNPVLTRPIIVVTNPNTQAMANPFPVSFPGAFAGDIRFSSSSGLWGLETNLVRNLAEGPTFRADLIAGFRYVDLAENFYITQNTSALAGGALFFDVPPGVITAFQAGLGPPPTPLPPGSSVTIVDRFEARNQVYAGQLGTRLEYRPLDWLALEFVGKVGFGPNHETLTVSGQTTAHVPGVADQSVPSGLLALSGANAGHYAHGWFVIMPEVSSGVAVNVGPHFVLHAGYDWLYINNVIRPARGIDLHVNPGFVPTSLSFGTGPQGANAPAREFDRKDVFWAQGLTAGIEFRY